MRRDRDTAQRSGTNRLYQSGCLYRRSSDADFDVNNYKTQISNTKMTGIIAGFICALILAALAIAWIVYCMFFKEKPKSKVQYGITDLQHKNYQIAQENEANKEDKKEVAITAGIFILPTRHKQKDDEYSRKRPDYPEGPVHMQPPMDKLVESFHESAIDADVHNRDIFDVDACAPYHSDV